MTRRRAVPSTVLAECPSAKAYRAGCDCQGCKDAIARYERHRTWEMSQGRPISRPTVGVMRRLRALSAIGWGIREISAQSGVGFRNAQLCRAGDQKFVRLETFNRICALYDRLWDQPGPSARARSEAASRGWAPPLAWDEDSIDDPSAGPDFGCTVSPIRDETVDLVAVDRWVTGDRWIRLTRLERAAALRQMLAEGMAGNEACEALGINEGAGMRRLLEVAGVRGELRQCVDCTADITARHSNAKRCLRCCGPEDTRVRTERRRESRAAQRVAS